MRVLLLNYEFPPLGGGAANATHYLLKEFSQMPEVAIDLVTSSIDQERVEQFSDNCTIYFEDIGKKGNMHYQSNTDLLSYSWKAYRRARKLMKTQEYDVVHAFFGIPCGYIAMKLGLPYIVSLRGSDVPFYNPRYATLDKLLFQRLSRRIWKRAEAVIANSTQLAQLAQQTSPQLHIPVIQNGVDTQEFAPQAHTNSPVRFLCVSRLIERKGVMPLVDTFAQLLKTTDAHLEFAGDGNLREDMEKRVQELGISEQVTFHGAVDHEKLPQIYAQADVFVLPSQNEGMSNTALEALASGLPLILTDTGGARELTQGNGECVPVLDSAALLNAMKTFATDAELRAEYARESRNKSEKYSWKSAALTYSEVYKNLVQ